MAACKFEPGCASLGTIVKYGWISVSPRSATASPQTTMVAPSRLPNARAASWVRTGCFVSSTPSTVALSGPSRFVMAFSTITAITFPSLADSSSRDALNPSCAPLV